MIRDPARSQGHRHARAIAGLHVAAVMFGLTGVIGAALALDALTITLARTLVAGAALAMLATLRGERLAPRWAFVANGALLALHWTTFFAAVKAGGVAAGALGYASFPMFVVLAEHLAAGAGKRASMRGATPGPAPGRTREAARGPVDAGAHRLDARAWSTLLLVTAGLAFTAAGRGFGPAPREGLLLGVVSGLAFAVLVVRNRGHAVATPDVRAVPLALWQNVFAAIWLLPLWLAWTPVPSAVLGSIDLRAAALLLLLGVGCTALAHTLLIGAMRDVGARVASVIVALEPVYAIVLSAWLLAQVPDLPTLCGAALVIAAAIVASRRASRPV